MRLWHYKLIPLLPRTQLLAQWRELNSIYKKQNKHILINYIYEYPKSDLYSYSILLLHEMKRRGYKIRNSDNFYNYFGDYEYTITETPFKKHHDNYYLVICYFNLLEKYMCGQFDFNPETKIKLDECMKLNNIDLSFKENL